MRINEVAMSHRIFFTILFLLIYPALFFLKFGVEEYINQKWQLSISVFFTINLIPACLLYIVICKLEFFTSIWLVLFLIVSSIWAYYQVLFVHWHTQGSDSALVLIPVSQTICLLLFSGLVYFIKCKLKKYA